MEQLANSPFYHKSLKRKVYDLNYFLQLRRHLIHKRQISRIFPLYFKLWYTSMKKKTTLFSLTNRFPQFLIFNLAPPLHHLPYINEIFCTYGLLENESFLYTISLLFTLMLFLPILFPFHLLPPTVIISIEYPFHCIPPPSPTPFTVFLSHTPFTVFLPLPPPPSSIKDH